jgi:hypothetical protein
VHARPARLRPSAAGQRGEQLLRAHEFAGQAVAHPHRERRRGGLVIHDDVEMGVEGRDLVDLDQGQPHLICQRHEVARVQAVVAVLQKVQMLDQEVGPARKVAQQGLHLVQRLRVDLTAARGFPRLAAPRAGVDAAAAMAGGGRFAAVADGRSGVVDVHRASMA